MARYHRRKDGHLSRCSKNSGSCRVAPIDMHWDSYEEALESFAKMPPSEKDRRISGIWRSSLSNKETGSGICLWCKKPAVGGLMNSHTVPRALLSQLTSDGLVLTSHYFLPSLGNLEISQAGEKPFVGVEKEALTFRLLCQSCDEIFSGYENAYYLKGWTPSQQELKEIALKNLLCRWFQWKRWDHLHSVISKDNQVSEDTPLIKLTKAAMAVKSLRAPQPHMIDALSARIELAHDWMTDGLERFTILHYEEIPWVTPMSGQGEFLWGFSDWRPKSTESTVHVAVLPSVKENNTKIIVFSDDPRFIKNWGKKIYGRSISKWISCLSDHQDEAFLWSPYLNDNLKVTFNLTKVDFLSEENSLQTDRLNKKLLTKTLLDKRDSFFLLGKRGGKRAKESPQELQAKMFLADAMLNPKNYKDTFIDKILRPPGGAKKYSVNGKKWMQTSLRRYLDISDHPKFDAEKLLDDLYGDIIDWSKSVENINHQLYNKYELTSEEIDFIEASILKEGRD